ncbi:MAG: spore germination protein [Clostridiales bacterium]|jgi:spore germination protein|nr:spore germination protein [Clostridiales bacterium]
MFSCNEKISVRQLQALVILYVFGAGVTVLPRRAAEAAGRDGWFVVILSAALAMLCVYVIASLAAIFPGEGFVDYSSKILSKPIGVLLGLGLFAKIIISSAMELRIFSEIVQQTMLAETPRTVVCALMLGAGVYAALCGYEVRGRIAEILLFITAPLTLVFFLLAAADADFSNLMPVMVFADACELIRGSVTVGMSFTGIELCLLVFPYINASEGGQAAAIRPALVKTAGLIGAAMVMATVIATAKFGAADLREQQWPVLELMDAIEFPGSFIERQDAIVMVFWISSVFAVMNAGIFFSALLLKDIFKKEWRGVYIAVSGALILGLAMLPRSEAQVYEIQKYIFYTFGAAYMIIIPLLIIIAAKLRKSEADVGSSHRGRTGREK